jgi:hypothetical protein
MLGMTKISVILGMTVIRSLLFILPALVIGLIISQILLYKLQRNAFKEHDMPLFSLPATLLALGLGMVVPLISSV